jgi:hypothetical protein
MRAQMKKFQDYLLDYFCDWVANRKKENNNLHDANYVFSTRKSGKPKLKDGKWFLGDDNYICVSLSNQTGGNGVSSIRLFLVMGTHGDITRFEIDMTENPVHLEADLKEILMQKADEFGIEYYENNRFFIKNLNDNSKRYPSNPDGLRASLDRMTTRFIPFLNEYLRNKNYNDIYIPIHVMKQRLEMIEPYRPGTLRRAGF